MCVLQGLTKHLSPQGPAGPQGPIGYPGPRGVKVRWRGRSSTCKFVCEIISYQYPDINTRYLNKILEQIKRLSCYITSYKRGNVCVTALWVCRRDKQSDAKIKAGEVILLKLHHFADIRWREGQSRWPITGRGARRSSLFAVIRKLIKPRETKSHQIKSWQEGTIDPIIKAFHWERGSHTVAWLGANSRGQSVFPLWEDEMNGQEKELRGF